MQISQTCSIKLETASATLGTNEVLLEFIRHESVESVTHNILRETKHISITRRTKSMNNSILRLSPIKEFTLVFLRAVNVYSFVFLERINRLIFPD